VPRLDPDDAMANAAVLETVLSEVPQAGGDGCLATPRGFSVMVSGRLSQVHFGARAVCQLQRLKEISAAQPGFGAHGLGEVAAFLLGRRLGEGPDVDVIRMVVPPFRFTRDTVTFVAADLGPLQTGEQFIGTYHTHPEGDVQQGVLSDIDLRYLRTGYADFHGQVGLLSRPSKEIDWLFDIVDPCDGDWNVFAHDGRRLQELSLACDAGPACPLEQLRLAGSPYYLLTRYNEE
jgi:proteasome lid subunit RPN8/RPN11